MEQRLAVTENTVYDPGADDIVQAEVAAEPRPPPRGKRNSMSTDSISPPGR